MQAYWIIFIGQSRQACFVRCCHSFISDHTACKSGSTACSRRCRRKGNKDMYDLIQTMLGQEVMVYVSDGSVSTVGGFLRKVEEG